MTQNTQQQRTTLVLGGTGKTGRRVAERLAARGRPVRIGSRSGAPPFDWEDRTTWEPVLRDAASVYLAYYPDAGFPGAADTIRAFTRTAERSGVERMVLLTGRGEEGAQRSEQAVRESGLAWTIVRSSFFAQNFSEDFLVEGVRSGAVAFPAGDVAEPFIDIEDIADVAVAALTEHGHAGRLYEVTGPRLLTFAEAIAEIAGASGRRIDYLPISPEEFASALTEHGASVGFATQLTDLLRTVLDGRNTHLADGVQRAVGREPRDFADYARDTAAGVWAS
ncbi:NAD(P)H-binding protein [Allosalinactinospora lopnorensis]|uniref:NAD(P)H-binding protein n=1 Tax=Allosalinactinospora lopnorensis TaxID=1352348 RepID=UPI000623FC15|nr:NAD(P)H-binding protein [Allosalinactinospora lopnorensis]